MPPGLTGATKLNNTLEGDGLSRLRALVGLCVKFCRGVGSVTTQIEASEYVHAALVAASVLLGIGASIGRREKAVV